jgi:chromosome segregation ATPase
MSFFENQILNALSSHFDISASPGSPSSAVVASNKSADSPTSVVTTNNFSEQNKGGHDILYENLESDSIFKLLDSLQWKEAISLMKTSPDEVSTWVTRNDKRGMKLLWRRLPIHEACVRKTTPEVVLRLLEIYPNGAEAKDNNGRTPLHHALIHDADINVIYQLIHAYRDALSIPDFWGKAPREYAMMSKSIHKKDILIMMNQSKEEIATIVQEIKDRLLKKSTFLQQMTNSNLNIKTQPNSTEIFLEEELEQARVESDIAYVQRDAALLDQAKLNEKIRELEQQLEMKNNSLIEMENISQRNKSLNSLLTRYEKKNTELEESIVTQKDIIKSIQQEAESKNEIVQAEIKEKEKLWKKTKEEYERGEEKMKNTITVLSDKLRRMDSNLDDTISILENDLDFEVDEKYNICVEEKVKHLEELVDLYKENVNNSKKELEVSKENERKLHIEVDQLNDELDQLNDEVDRLNDELEESNNNSFSLSIEKERHESYINDITITYKDQVMNLESRIKHSMEKIIEVETERDEFKKEVEVYKNCLDSTKERVASLEDLMTVYRKGSVDLEDDLDRTKASFLRAMDQLMERSDRVCRLEEELDHLTEECERMRESSYRGYGAQTSRSEVITPRDLYRAEISHFSSRRTRSRSPSVVGRRTRSRSPFMRG